MLNLKSVYADTFNADSFKKFNTASVSDNISGKENDQYKLTVEKGSNMQSVTGAGWYDKGTVVTATGTAKATYTDTGTTYTVDPNNSGHRYYAKHTYTVVPVNKTMDSAQTATINATENKSNGGGDQYKLTITKGTGVTTVTPTVGSYWYNKGSKVAVSATYNTGYIAKDGTGNYVMDSAHTTEVTSKGKDVTITFNVNGGIKASTGGKTNATATYGSAMPAMGSVPTKTGYNFVGFYDAASGGNMYYKANGASNKNWDKTDNTTLYAHYTAKTYTITFNANGGICNTANKTVTYDSTYGTLPTPTYTVDGITYIFNGWYTAKSGGTIINASDTVNITTNQTLYAQWTAPQLTICWANAQYSGYNLYKNNKKIATVSSYAYTISVKPNDIIAIGNERTTQESIRDPRTGKVTGTKKVTSYTVWGNEEGYQIFTIPDTITTALQVSSNEHAGSSYTYRSYCTFNFIPKKKAIKKAHTY